MASSTKLLRIEREERDGVREVLWVLELQRSRNLQKSARERA